MEIFDEPAVAVSVPECRRMIRRGQFVRERRNDLRARANGRARWKLTADGIEYRVSGIVQRGMENADVDRNRG